MVKVSLAVKDIKTDQLKNKSFQLQINIFASILEPVKKWLSVFRKGYSFRLLSTGGKTMNC